MSRFFRVQSFLKSFFIAVLLFYIAGCAPTRPDVLWPLPPDFPRIKFVKEFYSKRDFFGFSTADIILGATPMSGFAKPHAVYVDKNDTVFVTDTGLGAVHVFSKKGYSIFGGVAKPVGIATDSRGRIFVSDSKLDKVMVFDSKGNFFTAIGGKGDFKQPVGIVVNDALRRIYVVDAHENHVAVHDLESGKRLFTFGARGTEEGQFNYPSHMTMDPETGNLYIVDTMNGRVQIFDPDGRFISEFGRLGDHYGGFSRPRGIAFDTEGHIYVVDGGFNNVQIFDKEGDVLLAFGGYGSAPGRGSMILPAGVAVDSEDRIYVVDQWNTRVNVYQYLSERYRKEHPKEMERLTRGLGKTLED